MTTTLDYNFFLKEFERDRKYPHISAMNGGLFEDVFDFIGVGIEGLSQAIGKAIESIAHAIGHLGETIALIVRAIVGDVSWNEVLGSLGEMFQDIGAALVYLDPTYVTFTWLRNADLTSHAFNELDKFTGGMLTTIQNVSTLPARAMRGDPISTAELIADALFVVQVVMIVFTGPVGLGIMLGTMVGRQVCSKQTEAKDACMVAFQIVGAATGSWASAASGVTWGTAQATAEAAVGDQVMSTAEQEAWLAGDQAYQEFLANQAEAYGLSQTTAFLPHLSNAASQTLTQYGIDRATQRVVGLCQSGRWIGNHECQIMGQVISDYAKAPDNTNWNEFLASEVGRIGATELVRQWFPPDSPEAIAMKKWEIKVVEGKTEEVVTKKLDPKVILLAAGGVLALLAGAST